MDTIATILNEKGSVLHCVVANATVLHAAEKMSELRIGALLVCEDGAPIAIFTERDLLNRVVLRQLDPKVATVESVMTRNPVCIDPGVRVEEAMAVMTERRCRHLPVVDGGKVVGLVSIGDLVRYMSRKQSFEIHRLTEYIQGKYPA